MKNPEDSLQQEIKRLDAENAEKDKEISNLNWSLESHANRIDNLISINIDLEDRAEKAEAENAELRDRMKGIEVVHWKIKQHNMSKMFVAYAEEMWQAIRKAVEGK
jgi:septal ring factor EnvC (AmiA/AmiB activator)